MWKVQKLAEKFVCSTSYRQLRHFKKNLLQYFWARNIDVCIKFFPLRYTVPSAIVKFRIGSPKMARNEQVCAHQKSYRKYIFLNIFLTPAYRRECSCAPILWFFSVTSDGTTAEHRIFGQFRTSLRKDSVAIYAWIWSPFLPSVKRTRCSLKCTKHFCSVSRWRHKIRKIAVEILHSINNWTQTLLEILRMVTVEIVINSLFGRLTLCPASMHWPQCLDDAVGF